MDVMEPVHLKLEAETIANGVNVAHGPTYKVWYLRKDNKLARLFIGNDGFLEMTYREDLPNE